MNAKRLFITFSALLGLATALTSCIRWNTGLCIKDSFTSITGVDVDHPVDGKVYRTGDNTNPAYYMLAPEITFSPCHSLIATSGLYYSNFESRYPAYVQRTGKQRWVQVTPTRTETLIDRHQRQCHIPVPDCHWSYMQDVDKLPAGAVLFRQNVALSNRQEIEYYAKDAALPEAPLGAKVLAAPFTYAIDPVLTVGTNVVDAAFLVVAAPVATCWSYWEDREWGGRDLTAEEQDFLINQVNTIRVRKCGRDLNLLSFSQVFYRIDPRTGKFDWDYQRSMDGDTWLEELPYFVDRSKPCVLVLRAHPRHFSHNPSEETRQQLADLLQSQGYTVCGFLIDCENGKYLYYPR